MDKAVRGRKLIPQKQQRNRLVSSVRGIIERGFGTLKRVYGLARASYRGTRQSRRGIPALRHGVQLEKSGLLAVAIGYLRPNARIADMGCRKKA